MIAVSNRLQVAKGQEKGIRSSVRRPGAVGGKYAGVCSARNLASAQERLLHRADALEG